MIYNCIYDKLKNWCNWICYWGKTKQGFQRIRHPKGNFETNHDQIENHKDDFFFFESLESLLKEVDGVVICIPAETHFEIA